MSEECLICSAPLAYLEKDALMECAICHKKENSKTRCMKGHYICDACHTKGVDQIIGLCLGETSKDPICIMKKLMSQPFCHMHGPEHHVMVGAALLTAYKNAGGDLDLSDALLEMSNGGKACRAALAVFGAPVGQGSVPACLFPFCRNRPLLRRNLLRYLIK